LIILYSPSPDRRFNRTRVVSLPVLHASGYILLEGVMSLQELFENAENCAHLAEHAKDRRAAGGTSGCTLHGWHLSKVMRGWKEK
jgi:hypothetical protein